MKTYNRNTTLKNLITATAGLGFITAPLALAQASKPGTARGNSQQEHTSGKVDRKPLTTEVTETFVDGYTVPNQYRSYFTELPVIEEKNVVIRYHNGRAYFVNGNDWKIVSVVDLDNSVKAEENDSMLVKGYVIPEDRRTRFIDVASPEKEHSLHYYNNNAYYMDSEFRIVRKVSLKRQGGE